MTLTREVDFVTHLFEPRPWWYDFALCRGVDTALFFPGRGEDHASPRAICAECPVRRPCLEFALTSPMEKWGVWGGSSERERRRLRQERRV